MYNKHTQIQIGSTALKQLKVILTILFNSIDTKKSNFKISLDNILILTVKTNWFIKLINFIFIRKKLKIKYNIYTLLIEDIPKAFSLLSSGNYSFKRIYLEEIRSLVYKYDTNESEKIEYIINYLYSILLDLKPKNYWGNLELLNLSIKNNRKISNTPNNNLINVVEEPEEEGLTYILDTFMWGSRKVNIKKEIISFLLSFMLRAFPIYSYEENIDTNNIYRRLYNFYTSKSPPFKNLPYIKQFYYNVY